MQEEEYDVAFKDNGTVNTLRKLYVTDTRL